MLHTHTHTHSATQHIVYTTMCVCVCVCLRVNMILLLFLSVIRKDFFLKKILVSSVILKARITLHQLLLNTDIVCVHAQQ
jgi:hypothetical protein